MTKPIIFISGYADLSRELFEKYYVPFIKVAIEAESLFVVGDDDGCAAMAQEVLANLLPKERLSDVTVFYLKDTPRNLVSYDFVQCEGFRSDDEKNAAMTICSTGDLAFTFGKRTMTFVDKNILRRTNPEFNYKQYITKGNSYFWNNIFKNVKD